MTRGMERPAAVAPVPVLSGMERPVAVTPALPAARRRAARTRTARRISHTRGKT